MEEVMLCIVRLLTDTPDPLHGLPDVPQCSKKTERSLELLHHTPSSLNQPLNKCQTIIRQGSLGTLKVLGLPKHSSCLQCTSMPLMPLGTGRLGPQSNPAPDNRFLLSHEPEAFVQQTR